MVEPLLRPDDSDDGRDDCKAGGTVVSIGETKEDADEPRTAVVAVDMASESDEDDACIMGGGLWWCMGDGTPEDPELDELDPDREPPPP